MRLHRLRTASGVALNCIEGMDHAGGWSLGDLAA
jgi:hypothetical protein